MTPVALSSPIQARMLKVKSFSDSDPDALDSAVQAWLDSAGEKRAVAILSAGDSSAIIVTIFYTEG